MRQAHLSSAARMDWLILLGAGTLASVLLLVVTTYNGIAG